MILRLLLFVVGLCMGCPLLVSADDAAPSYRHGEAVQEQGRLEGDERCGSGQIAEAGVESVQLETSDITLYERFFESVLHARPMLRKDHPQRDMLRGYCYRSLLIVVRQDVRQPRPTGWVQINFSERDVGRLQEMLQRSYERSPIFRLEEAERDKIVRFRLKPDVKRGSRKAVRLEVSGPEGFMIGFDQYK
ncbi:MAG: hypothetical protein KF693_18870 [Nitrospira sp.]|nr:hypothetical protein [Nitrospira sp.]